MGRDEMKEREGRHGEGRTEKERDPNASAHMWRPEDSLREEIHYLLSPHETHIKLRASGL